MQDLEALTHSLNLTNQVTFAGAIPYDAMPQFFNQGHLYLQTSRHESQGMSVLEAMACGLLVIGTPVGVTADLAALPATTDPQTLATQAATLLCDPALYQTHRQHARQIVIEDYSLEKTVQRFLAVYQQLSA